MPPSIWSQAQAKAFASSAALFFNVLVAHDRKFATQGVAGCRTPAGLACAIGAPCSRHDGEVLGDVVRSHGIFGVISQTHARHPAADHNGHPNRVRDGFQHLGLSFVQFPRVLVDHRVCENTIT